MSMAAVKLPVAAPARPRRAAKIMHREVSEAVQAVSSETSDRFFIAGGRW